LLPSDVSASISQCNVNKDTDFEARSRASDVCCDLLLTAAGDVHTRQPAIHTSVVSTVSTADRDTSTQVPDTTPLDRSADESHLTASAGASGQGVPTSTTITVTA